jgi:hypothetical protein
VGVLVSVALFVSACTIPGASLSNPSALLPEEAYAGPRVEGNGDGGYREVTSSAAGQSQGVGGTAVEIVAGIIAASSVESPGS